jgi:hypothetical protein
MSCNFTQICIVGIAIEEDNAKVILSEAIYEDQPVYDTRTGKVLKTQRVTVKDEESHYAFDGETGYDLWTLGESLAKKYDISYTVDDDKCLYLGYKIGDQEDCGRVDLLTGYVNVSEIRSNQIAIESIFPDYEAAVFFVTHVG